MVGSIKTTVNEGEQIKRGQEFGYFAFGELVPAVKPVWNLSLTDVC